MDPCKKIRTVLARNYPIDRHVARSDDTAFCPAGFGLDGNIARQSMSMV